MMFYNHSRILCAMDSTALVCICPTYNPGVWLLMHAATVLASTACGNIRSDLNQILFLFVPCVQYGNTVLNPEAVISSTTSQEKTA
jgi:hypothetical protein